MWASSSAQRKDFLNVKVPRNVKRKLMRAAALRGTTLNDFIVTNMLPLAEAVIQEHGAIRVSPRDYDRLMNILDNPPKPNSALLSLMEDYENAILNGEIAVED